MMTFTSSKVSDDNSAYQNPLSFLNLSSRCSNLSRALSTEHVYELGGSCLRDPLLTAHESATMSLFSDVADAYCLEHSHFF
jgi:hypothetical protein